MTFEMGSKSLLPKVSVIIPCFNVEKFLADAVETVFQQSYRNYEIILVDDGSTDRTKEIIRSFGQKVRSEFISHQGASAARNRGTALSQGEFIQYLDADDRLSPTSLDRRVNALLESSADVAYSDWQRFSLSKDGVLHYGDIISHRIEDVHANPEIALFTDFWCPLAAYLFRREIVEKVGGWNQRLPVIQDARFALDCALHGARFIYCPGLLAYYRIGSGGSLSRRAPVGFVRDCFQNAAEVEIRWNQGGGISLQRRQALLKVYGYIARASFEKDRPTFEKACRAFEKLDPRYVPEIPPSKYLPMIAQCFGYRRTEAAALWYRKGKKLLRNLCAVSSEE